MLKSVLGDERAGISWDANKPAYIATIQSGMDMNYEPMAALVRRSLGG